MNPLLIRIPRTASTSICIALGKEFEHKPASQLKRELGAEWDKCFKFTIVRNPYDRFISIFKRFNEGLSLDNFFEKEIYNKNVLFKPQAYYLDEPIDYIGRFEELNKSWDYISKQLDIGLSYLPLISKGNNEKIRLTDKQKEIIRSYYQKDFELLNYS